MPVVPPPPLLPDGFVPLDLLPASDGQKRGTWSILLLPWESC